MKPGFQDYRTAKAGRAVDLVLLYAQHWAPKALNYSKQKHDIETSASKGIKSLELTV
jgi:hypothetical protein